MVYVGWAQYLARGVATSAALEEMSKRKREDALNESVEEIKVNFDEQAVTSIGGRAARGESESIRTATGKQQVQRTGR